MKSTISETFAEVEARRAQDWQRAADHEAEARKHIAHAFDLLLAVYGSSEKTAEQLALYAEHEVLRRVPARPVPAKRKPERQVPYDVRKVVLERDAYRCQMCGDWHNLAVDHIKPKSKGGPDTLDNLRVLCQSCNSRKGTRDA